MSWKYRVNQVTTVLLVLLFGLAGLAKLFPHMIKDPENDLVSESSGCHGNRVHAFFFFGSQIREFRKFATIPPFNQIGLDADLFRILVGCLELGCVAILIIGNPRMKTMATYVLAIIMIGAIYTHYMINDPVQKMVASFIASILILLRLFSTGNFKVKIN